MHPAPEQPSGKIFLEQIVDYLAAAY